MKTYVTVKEAAGVVCRDERTVRRWIKDGRLTAYRSSDGRTVVVLQDAVALEAFLRGSRRRRVSQHVEDLIRSL